MMAWPTVLALGMILILLRRRRNNITIAVNRIAIGKWVESPATPEKVLKALGKT
jgi:hypothetical protein